MVNQSSVTFPVAVLLLLLLLLLLLITSCIVVTGSYTDASNSVQYITHCFVF
jgi:hypothetical protein